ncbi:MAG TPA: hypothetical protein VNK67_11855 [Burkholderiales bacterium]|nr:hypothetical protein [Burkholderiales bacterium]
MNLASKLLAPGGAVLLYGTTPPREGSAEEAVRFAAQRLGERVRRLPLDGLVVYDLQDESSRTPLPRPFPFSRTLDSRLYSKLLATLTGLPAITYHSIGQATEEEWRRWLDETGREPGLRLLSIVGRPSSKGAHYAMPLLRAFEIAAAHRCGYTLGGVAIAERHRAAASESRRMLEKARAGCRFFVSQTVYHAGPTVRLLADYVRDCAQAGTPPRRVILTFAPCGREKTMAFIKWLGIEVPEATERAILDAPDPLAKSIAICRDNLREILEQDYLGRLPLGLNIESVSINRDEIDASVELFHTLAEVLLRYLPAAS